MHLHHEISGPVGAPALVLLNSIGGTTAMWAACAGRLSEHYRVIRMDARGHGGSAVGNSPTAIGLDTLAGDVLSTLDALGVDRFHLAGQSLGGMTAMWLAIHHPERIIRLALVCTSAYLPPPSNWLDRAAKVRESGLADIADEAVARWITPALAQRDPDLFARLRDALVACDREDYAQCCEAISEMDLRSDLGRISAPTLVISADEDPATPPVHGEAIAAGVPGARFEIVHDAAHVATVEQPARIADLMLDHLGGTGTLARGFAIRREVLGDAHVNAAITATTPLTEPFQDFITRYAWGEIWSRTELGHRERSIATLAALIAIGAEKELALHVRAALRNGLTATEIAEVCLHTAVYAGVPRANSALGVIQRTLAES